MESVVSILLARGTQSILEGDNHSARLYAMYACNFEQFVADEVHRTKFTISPVKIFELRFADDHMLIEYLRKRIPWKSSP
eukprot:scaffold5895_cov169-Skeletonema_dohrnii-CCMP3373.AAC.1